MVPVAGIRTTGKRGLVMAVMRWRPFGPGLEPWVGARELGDIQSEVRASYSEGVLTVTLQKVEAVKPKEIKIDVL